MPAPVNVVTVTYNNEATVERLLRSLATQSDQVGAVVVVDNGSTDGTVAMVRALTGLPFVPEVLEGSNAGFAGGYLRAATASAVLDRDADTLCVNPDVELADGTIAKLGAALAEEARAAIVTAPLVRTDGTPDPSCIRTLPRLGGSLIYGVIGRLTPKRHRYNASPTATLAPGQRLRIEATTGALMLVRAAFRSARDGIFDASYWMYGEDLQLCKDAESEGHTVLMCEMAPSLHIKGVSSGLPRRWRSNVAFHQALALYYRKNLSPARAVDPVVVAAVYAKLLASHGASVVHRSLQHRSELTARALRRPFASSLGRVRHS